MSQFRSWRKLGCLLVMLHGVVELAGVEISIAKIQTCIRVSRIDADRFVECTDRFSILVQAVISNPKLKSRAKMIGPDAGRLEK